MSGVEFQVSGVRCQVSGIKLPSSISKHFILDFLPSPRAEFADLNIHLRMNKQPTKQPTTQIKRLSRFHETMTGLGSLGGNLEFGKYNSVCRTAPGKAIGPAKHVLSKIQPIEFTLYLFH